MHPQPFDLTRFVHAQDPIYAQALQELRNGRKRTHWMWFIFPQLAALGRSPKARHFGITGRDEAMAFLAHPVLGPRLRECAHALLRHRGTDITAILGAPDDLKLRSCATLFDAVGGSPEFAELLTAFFDGAPDQQTLALLAEIV